MNFTTQVVINRPRPHVLELISNPDNLAVWQPGLKSVELLAGKRTKSAPDRGSLSNSEACVSR